MRHGLWLWITMILKEWLKMEQNGTEPPVLESSKSYIFHKIYWWLQGTEDEVVNFSHGKQLWELCKEKYEPLWLKGGNHCNLELYPEYLKHLKKFISAIEKLPPHVSAQSTDQPEQPLNAAGYNAEKPRPSTDHKEKARPSFGQREKSRLSTDNREKARASTDRRERTRKSIDRVGKARNSTDQQEKARNSFDRFVQLRPGLLCFTSFAKYKFDEYMMILIIGFGYGRLGDMVRSVGLCNVDCLKQTAAEAWSGQGQ